MNILSLFDGMSCGQIALERVGIKVDRYFASEIDKHAINVTQYNYPNTIQVGNVINLNGSDLPKIDLLIGGSPCQGFSIAGNQLNFDHPQSKLFFEYIRILNEANPKYFLLENVKMKREYQDVITMYLGVEPIEINSNSVSAQHRRRLYWTNIPLLTYPINLGLKLKDIIEDNIGGKKVIFNDGICKFKAKNNKNVILEEKHKPPYAVAETRTEEGKLERKRLKKLLGRDTNPRGINYKEYRINLKYTSNCILTSKSEQDCIVDRQYNYRHLTLVELERLQTIPDNYTNYVSDNQRHKMIGNGWTVDVIKHILQNLL